MNKEKLKTVKAIALTIVGILAIDLVSLILNIIPDKYNYLILGCTVVLLFSSIFYPIIRTAID